MRILCVHDDARELERLRRVLLERESSWDVRLAESSDTALQAVREWSPDAIVAGLGAQRMDGAALLERVREASPEVIRFAVGAGADADRGVSALRVAHRAMPDVGDGAALVESLRRSLLLRDLVKQPPLRGLLGQVGPLPAAPIVYAELTRRLDDPAVSVIELGELVSEDAALAAHVLRLSNSAYFGRDKAVTRIVDAAARLGTRLLRSLVLTAEVYGRFPTSGQVLEQIAELQRHSALVARIASSLEPHAAWTDDAFTAGLLHDLGKLVLLSRMPDRFADIRRQAGESGRPEHEVEQERLGAHHGTLGACLLGMWGLPSVVLDAVNGHHDIALDVPHALNAPRAVALADRLAHDVADSEEQRERRIPLPVAVVTDPRWGWWREMADQLAHEVTAV